MKILKYRHLSTFVCTIISPFVFASNVETGADSATSYQRAQIENRVGKSMSQNSEQEAVIAAVNNYLMGISDAKNAQERIQAAFYSSTNLHSLDEDGNLKFQPRDSLIEMVKAGNVPEHKGSILNVEVTNDMAFAKVHLDLSDRDFYDYLTLLKLNIGWKIVSKTYTTVMK